MLTLPKEMENQLMRLPAIERACIAEKLLSSLDSPNQEEMDQAWAVEVEDRIQAFQRGELEASDASDVHKRLEEKYNI